MILQNISKAIREQNWFAVFLEFVIVIAGVVIGFQVTAWNAERAERARGVANLALLVHEIRQHNEEYQRMSEGAAAILVHIRTLSEATAAPETARENWEAVLTAAVASRTRAYMPVSRTVYEGMESSGEIALIPDKASVQAIRGYYQSEARWRTVFGGSWDPWREYNYAMTGYLSSREITAIYSASRDNAPLTGFEPEDAVDLARRLGNDPDVQTWLSGIGGYQEGVRTQADSFRRQTDALLTDLDASLAALRADIGQEDTP